MQKQQTFTHASRLGRSIVVAVVAIAGGLAAAMPAAADTTLRVYRSHMPDGSVVLGDRPATGARSVQSSSYAVSPARQGPGGAEAEREYWRQQADAFAQRQARRDALQGPGGRGGYHGVAHREADAGYGYAVGYVGRPLVPIHRVDPVYRSSPGAVRGRDFGFIGSGFGSAR